MLPAHTDAYAVCPPSPCSPPATLSMPPPATLSMPPPAAHRPLRPAATALSILPPPPSPSSHRRWAGVHSYGAAPARSASLCVMAAVPGGGGSRMTDGGDEFGVCGVQPVPRPVVCTVPLRATAPPPPSTHRRCPLHAAAALYTLPPPSTHCHCALHATAITHHNGEHSTFQRAHNLLP